MDKGLAELEEKLTNLFNPKILELDVKIDSVKEELKPKIDKLRDRFDDIKSKFEEFTTKFEDFKTSQSEKFDSLDQHLKRSDK